MFERVRKYVRSRIGFLSQVARSEEGATIIEYILIAAVVVLGLTLVFGNLRDALRQKVQDIIDAINDAPGS